MDKFEDLFNECEEIKINKQLNNMYKKWRETCLDELRKLKETQNPEIPFSRPFLLTCNDMYLKHRVMFIGREAHECHEWTPESLMNGYLEFKNEPKIWYDFDMHMVNRQDRDSSWKLKETRFVRTRRIASGVCGECKRECSECTGDCLAALVNNLNKVSLMGEYTPTASGRKRETKVFTEKYPNIAYIDALYKPFELPEEDAMSLNIVQHEIRILKPEKIVFCFGKGYDGQFERDFGKEVYNKVRDLIASLSITEKPVSESREITLFGTGDKAVKVNVIFTLHPSAHMSGDSKGGIRKKYNDEIANFVNSSNLG